VLGAGNIDLNSKFSLSKVLLVESLGYNLLSISQLCASGFNCLFTNEGVTVTVHILVMLDIYLLV
jgi:hypothetical protein